jgi:anti-sigma B factor antagonist
VLDAFEPLFSQMTAIFYVKCVSPYDTICLVIGYSAKGETILMEIHKRRDGESLTVTLKGRLDTTTSPLMEAELKDELDKATLLRLDFAGLEYISSAGLRVLLSLQKKMTGQGGRLTVGNVSEGVMEIFDMTGFSKILSIE